MLAYHFIAPDLKTRYNNLQAQVGEWLEVEGEIKLCENGLHASVHPWDALTYAVDVQTTLCLVELDGDVQQGDDKVCARKRKILKTVDAKQLFQKIALFAAKEVLPIFEKQYPGDNRVRNCIEVTERYLEGKATKEELEVARSAASAARAARTAATHAARAARAAHAAYCAADWSARAAHATAHAACWAADWAARAAHAAYCAARTARAAYYATDAARAACWAADWAAARGATKRRIRDEFQRMVDEAFAKVP